MSNISTTVMHPADNGGCGHYRMKFPAWALQTMSRDIRIIESSKMIPLPQFYHDVRHVRVQRQVSPGQVKYFKDFIQPMSKSVGFWTTYDIDDVIGPDDIPIYNVGRDAYQAEGIKESITEILNAVDFVTVTTEQLKAYYVDNFGVPTERIIVIPNYLPRWWIGEAYDENRIKDRFTSNKRKPRIGIASSSTHYDLKGVADYKDDFHHVVQFIRSTVNKYQWVFVGGCPALLSDLAKDGKIEVHNGSDILNYPRELTYKNLDVVIAPLQDNTFNRCKSNIKWLEFSALGIPCIAQNLAPYQGHTDLLFDDANDLQNQLDKVLKNKGSYMNIVRDNRNTIDYGLKEGDSGWWLEKNIDKWFNLFNMPQKTISIDSGTYNKYNEQLQEKNLGASL